MTSKNDVDEEALTLAAGEAVRSSVVLEAPQLLADRYELLGLVGAGGMGSVYRVRDRELDEIVALKMLRRELEAEPSMLQHFRQEVRLARKVTSPHVARVFDIGEHDGARFLTMELVEGEPLSSVLLRERVLAFDRAIAIASAVCVGLSAAHDVGIIHRDLKPENVLLSRDGSIKIADFGIAMVVASGAATPRLVGTPAYMAPEQVLGVDKLDARTDLYALGVILYEMVTGELPFTAPSPLATAAMRLMMPAPDPRELRPDMPAALAELLLSCMAKEVTSRPRDATAVGAMLARITQAPRALPPRPQKSVVAPAMPPSTSLAVLPFKNSGPADDGYLADGLTDDLVDRLSMARGLRVCSRGAVEAAGTSLDPRALGQRLGVQVFVEGSIRRVGTRLRVAARLVSVADGFQVWAERFDGEARDILKLGDAAAEAVSRALMVNHAALRPATALETDVLELYLRGRRAYHAFGPAQAREAVHLLRRAAASAPDDPTILAGYSLALVRLIAFAPDSPDMADDPLAVAERAAELAPMLGDTHVALSSMLLHAGDYARTTSELRVALELAPLNPEGNALLGRLLCETGRLEDGLRRLRAALQLDPRLEIARLDEARAYGLLGDGDTSEAILARAGKGSPANAVPILFTRIRFAHWARRDLASLMATVRGTPIENDPLLTALLRLGRPEVALDPRIVDWIRSLIGRRNVSVRRRAHAEQLLVETFCIANQHEQASVHLVNADDALLLDIAWLDRCPLLAPLRESETFRRVRASVLERASSVLAGLGVS